MAGSENSNTIWTFTVAGDKDVVAAFNNIAQANKLADQDAKDLAKVMGLQTQGLNETADAANNATKGVDTATTAHSNLEKALLGVTRGIASQVVGFTLIAGAWAAVGHSVGIVINDIIDAGKQLVLAEAKVEAAVPNVDMGQVSAQLISAATTARSSAGDIADAFVKVEQAFHDTQQAGFDLAANIALTATANEQNVKDWTAAAVEATLSYGGTTTDVAHTQDLLTVAMQNSAGAGDVVVKQYGALAQAGSDAGQSQEQVTAAIIAATSAGGDASRNLTGLRMLLDAMGTTKADASFEKLGISLHDAQGNATPLYSVLVQLQAALSSMSASQADQALAAVVPDRRSREAIEALLADLDTMNTALTQTLPDGIGAAQKRTADYATSTKGEMDAARASVASLASEFGTLLMDIPADFVKSGQDARSAFDKGFKDGQGGGGNVKGPDVTGTWDLGDAFQTAGAELAAGAPIIQGINQWQVSTFVGPSGQPAGAQAATDAAATFQKAQQDAKAYSDTLNQVEDNTHRAAAETQALNNFVADTQWQGATGAIDEYNKRLAETGVVGNDAQSTVQAVGVASHAASEHMSEYGTQTVTQTEAFIELKAKVDAATDAYNRQVAVQKASAAAAQENYDNWVKLQGAAANVTAAEQALSSIEAQNTAATKAHDDAVKGLEASLKKERSTLDDVKTAETTALQPYLDAYAQAESAAKAYADQTSESLNAEDVAIHNLTGSYDALKKKNEEALSPDQNAVSQTAANYNQATQAVDNLTKETAGTDEAFRRLEHTASDALYAIDQATTQTDEAFRRWEHDASEAVYNIGQAEKAALLGPNADVSALTTALDNDRHAAEEAAFAIDSKLIPVRERLAELNAADAAAQHAKTLEQERVSVENLAAQLASAVPGTARYIELQQQIAGQRDQQSRDSEKFQLEDRQAALDAEKQKLQDIATVQQHYDSDALYAATQRRDAIQREFEARKAVLQAQLDSLTHEQQQYDYSQSIALFDQNQAAAKMAHLKAEFDYKQSLAAWDARNAQEQDKQIASNAQAKLTADQQVQGVSENLVSTQLAGLTAIRNEDAFNFGQHQRLLDKTAEADKKYADSVKSWWDNGPVAAQTAVVTNLQKTIDDYPVAALKSTDSAKAQVEAAKSVQTALQGVIDKQNEINRLYSAGGTLPAGTAPTPGAAPPPVPPKAPYPQGIPGQVPPTPPTPPPTPAPTPPSRPPGGPSYPGTTGGVPGTSGYAPAAAYYAPVGTVNNNPLSIAGISIQALINLGNGSPYAATYWTPFAGAIAQAINQAAGTGNQRRYYGGNGP